MHDNSEVLKRARILKNNNNKENLESLMQALSNANVYIPAMLPPDTPVEIINELAKAGVDAPMPSNIKPNLSLIVNKEQKRFLPGFTSHDEIDKNPDKNRPKHFLIVGMPFKNCVKIVAENPGIEGFVLNPYSENIIINISKNDNKANPIPHESEDVRIRRKLEIDSIPKKVFGEENFVLNLIEDPVGEVLKIYEEVYGDKEIPYSEDEFDSMVLNLSDDLTFIRINMPKKNNLLATAESIFVLWNPNLDNKAFFAVVKDIGKDKRLFRVLPNLEKMDVGEAPDESMEIESISEIFKNEQ